MFRVEEEILRVIKKHIKDEKAYNIAREILMRYLSGKDKSVRDYLLKLLKEVEKVAEEQAKA